MSAGQSHGIISVPQVNAKYDDISRLVIQADINIASGNKGGAFVNTKLSHNLKRKLSHPIYLLSHSFVSFIL